MYLTKQIFKNNSFRTSRYFSLAKSLNKNNVGFVEHDIFSKTFQNVIKGAENTEEKLFVYVNTGPPKLITIEKLDRNDLFKTLSNIYSV